VLNFIVSPVCTDAFYINDFSFAAINESSQNLVSKIGVSFWFKKTVVIL
jgi:hypothetical protein